MTLYYLIITPIYSLTTILICMLFTCEWSKAKFYWYYFFIDGAKVIIKSYTIAVIKWRKIRASIPFLINSKFIFFGNTTVNNLLLIILILLQMHWLSNKLYQKIILYWQFNNDFYDQSILVDNMIITLVTSTFYKALIKSFQFTSKVSFIIDIISLCTKILVD